MKYCSKCGSKLINKYEINEGDTPYCPTCNEFRYPMFNDAISCVILNKNKDKVLLIKQYGKDKNILVAGYLSKGETPAEALKREIKEEVNLNVLKYRYNESSYYEKSNSLLHNFVVIVDDENFKIKEDEVDEANWFDINHVREDILQNSLAAEFLNAALDKINKNEIII